MVTILEKQLTTYREYVKVNSKVGEECLLVLL